MAAMGSFDWLAEYLSEAWAKGWCMDIAQRQRLCEITHSFHGRPFSTQAEKRTFVSWVKAGSVDEKDPSWWQAFTTLIGD